METVLTKIESRITHFVFVHEVLTCSQERCLIVKHTSIFRELISRDFLKHEVLSQQRLATPIQVKGSRKQRKNATNGKLVFLFKKEQSHTKILPRNTKIKLNAWYMAPKTHSQLLQSSYRSIVSLTDYVCIGLNVAAETKIVFTLRHSP